MADPASVTAFESACQDVQVPATRPAAELVLNQLAARPDALQLALAVAASTSSPVARFHAADTLRSAAVRSWHTLPHEQRYGPTSLRNQLVALVAANNSLTPLERKAVLRTAAVLARRGYLEEPRELWDVFLSQVCATAASGDCAACELLEFLADEFLAPALPRSTPALQRELVLHSRATFASPDGDMLRVLRAALAALSALLTAPNQPLFEARIGASLATVLRVLTTDVAHLDALPPLDDVDAAPAVEALEAVVISAFARAEWAAIIAELVSVVRVCFAITGLYLPQMQNADAEPDVVAKATQIVTAVAAVSRGSYPNPEDGRRMLATLMDGINEQKWAASPAGVVRLAYAEVWRRVSCAHGLGQLEGLGSEYLETFTRDTCAELDSVSVRLAEADEDVFSMDVVDLLLETWANLALQADDGGQGEHPLSEPIGRVVYNFTRMSLRSMGEAASYYQGGEDVEEDLGFEDMSIADSRLAVAAILTRFVLPKMAPAIAQSLLMVADKVFQWRQAPQALPLDLFQEDLFFLVRLTAAVLADDAKGEHPSVPIQFMGGGELKGSPHGQMLMSALFEVSQGETNLLERRGVHCEEASPRVGSAILDALSRVTKTYLAPLNGNAAAMSAEAIGGTLATNGRAGCFKKAIEGISQRGFETDIAESAANLLATLAAGAMTYVDVRESPAWQTLLQAGAEAYQTLPVEAVQHVGRSLTLVLGDVVAQQLLLPAYNSLRAFAESKERAADAAERAIATINLLRGAARCEKMGVQTREALLHALRAPDGVAAGCAKSFARTRPDVGRALLKLADDLVIVCLSTLQEQAARDLLTNVVTLIKMHTEIMGQFRAEATEDDIASDVEEIVLLLGHVLDEADIDVGEAIYYGLSTVLPIMNDSVLAIPSVSSAFFRLTTRLVSYHPNKLAVLPPQFCDKMLQTIELQRASVEIGFERRSLEAVTALARARLTQPDNGPSAGLVHGALLRFLKAIFDGIASGAAHTSNMDAAADALLPLMHLRTSGSKLAFDELGQGLLISSGNDETLRAAIEELGRAATHAGGVHGLQSGNGHVSTSHERAGRIQATKAFREAVTKFSGTARKCLLSIAIGASNG